MEIKKYVLFNKECNNMISKISNLRLNKDNFEYTDEFNGIRFSSNYEWVVKTSDNLLDLVEVSDLVKLHRENTLYIVKKSKPINIVVEDMYGEDINVRREHITLFYKLQRNGDYRKYIIEVKE